MYDIEDDEFIEYLPEHTFLYRFPYDYNPNAPVNQEIWDVLTKVADNDNDVLTLILESFGYCFYRENRYKKTFLLKGENGNNGKSTILNILKQLIGMENISTLSIQDFSGVNARFRVAELYGKVVNIHDDMSANYIEESNIFKTVSSGGTFLVENKGEDPFDCEPTCKLFFYSEYPTIFMFSGVKKDMKICYARTAESNRIEQWEPENDPVKAYVEECGCPEGQVNKTSFFKAVTPFIRFKNRTKT